MSVERFEFAAVLFRALLLLVFSSVFAVAVNPFLIGSAHVSASLFYTVGLNGQQPNSLLLKVLGFYNTSAQSALISSPTPYSSGVDSSGNSLLSFQLYPTVQSQQVVLNLDANVDYLNWIGFGSVDPAYLQSSTYVILNPETQQTALQIIGNASNPFEKVALLVSWVHDNVKYEGSGLSEVIMNSSWVLQNRVGKCSEFSHLFIALARSAGIPAKFVAGLVYNGDSWALHAWSEVYVEGEWYPVDPTFDEAFVLDGSHVEMAEGVDQSVVNNVLSGAGNFNLSAISLNSSLNATLVGYTPFNVVNVTLVPPESPVGSGSFETVKAVVVNELNQNIATPLFLSVPQGVTILSPQDRLVYLPPFASKTVSWGVLTPQMKPNYIYNYTVQVDYLGGSMQSFFSGNNQAKINSVQGFQLSPLIIYQNGSGLTVTSTLSNTGSEVLNVSQTAVLQNQVFSDKLTLSPGGQASPSYFFQVPVVNESGFVETNWSGGNYSQPFSVSVQPPASVPSTQNSSSEFQPAGSSANYLILGLTVTFLFLIVLLIVRKIKRS